MKIRFPSVPSVARLVAGGSVEDDPHWHRRSWRRLGRRKREELRAKGWNAKAWDANDPELMDYYNEAEMDWEDLPDDRRRYWIDRGYDEQKWDDEFQPLHDDPRTPSKGIPKVLTLNLEGIDRYNFSYYLEHHGDKNIQVKKGKVDLSDEHPIADLEMSDFIGRIRRGDTTYKFNAEDMDVSKDCFGEVEKETKKALLNALTKSELGGNDEDAPFKPEWQHKDPAFFNWSIWMGAGGTKTPMHFDTDLFNFLYVVEGKKRILLVPKNKLTDKRFPLKEYYSGSGYTGVDIIRGDVRLPKGSMELEVRAGQGIFIPFRWWHAVDNVESNVAYGFRVTE